MLPIRPIHKISKPEEIIRQIKSLIDGGHLVPGSRLPGEREFAGMLDVSRPSLREALRALSLLGIIEHRPGSGTYLIASGDRWPGEPLAILFSINKSALIEIFEARKGMEGLVAGLAAERRSEENLKSMREALEGMARSLSDPEVYFRHDMKFHAAVVEAAGNQVIGQVMGTLYRLLGEAREQFYRFGFSTLLLKEKDYNNHRKIYRRIAGRDSRGASAAMIRHLLEFERFLAADNAAPKLSKPKRS
ncbi:MAG: FadR family transcriptional regulator [Acidobacteria bacterium]|nr:FadR family transcriptional regulator [Acidobacteriota bacterium]